jgi:hypothetical protein
MIIYMCQPHNDVAVPVRSDSTGIVELSNFSFSISNSRFGTRSCQSGHTALRSDEANTMVICSVSHNDIAASIKCDSTGILVELSNVRN